MRKLATLLFVVLILPLVACTYPTEVRYVEVPAVEAPTPETPEAPVVVESKWDIYVIDSADEIVLHDDCTNWDGWASREEYRSIRGEAFRSTAQWSATGEHTPWRYVDGIIWYPGCGR